MVCTNFQLAYLQSNSESYTKHKDDRTPAMTAVQPKFSVGVNLTEQIFSTVDNKGEYIEGKP